MANSRVITIDLNFQRKAHAIASYLVRDGENVVLIECGPASTLMGLEAGLASEGLTLGDVTHVLLTHIHLDHAGAAGHLARAGAQIFVHPNGAAHLLNPEKLIASATRIYGDRMDQLWGEILPVEADRLTVPREGIPVRIGSLEFIPVDTPGHAEHHYAYLLEDVCFSGDIGGVRIPGYAYLRAPMPPPELHLGRWHASLAKLKSLKIARIAPTHFGIYDDVAWQLNALDENLTAVEQWLMEVMPSDPTIEELRAKLERWMADQARKANLSADVLNAYTLANPLGMSADGLMRYWKKVRAAA